MKHFRAVAILFAIVWMTSCGSSSSTSLATNLTGNWQFVGTSSSFGVQSTANGSLQQSGNNITGQVNLTGTPCATSAAVTGSISGNSLTFQLQESGQAVSFTGTTNAAGSSASGNYTAPAGGCTQGDFGTWVGNKI